MFGIPNLFDGAVGSPPQRFSFTWLGDSLVSVFGESIRNEAFAGISWLHFILSALVLAATVAFGHWLRWLLRCRIRDEVRKTSASAEGVSQGHDSWLKLILEAGIPPLTLFVWTRGAYAALWLLVAPTQAEGQASVWLQVLDKVVHAASLAILFWFFFRMADVVELRLKSWAARTARKWDDVVAVMTAKAIRLATPLLGVILFIPTLDVPEKYERFFDRAASLLLIAAVGFILSRLVSAAEQSVIEQYRTDVKDNLATRKVQTQVRVLKRLAVVMIVTISAASMLMVFESVRQLGTSLLASAGVAGIVIGFAAQRSIATFVAGFQIAFTQPIRLDDVVIVESEYGNVEEIALTYVVIRTWDLRRLVVPINYFIEKPFQNWTRVSADLLCAVTLHTDYTAPIAELRKEFTRLLQRSNHWDRKVNVLQVTDAKDRTIELRALASAASAGAGWNLRCEVREGLIDFLQRNHPQCLPRTRMEVAGFPQGNGKLTAHDAERETHLLSAH